MKGPKAVSAAQVRIQLRDGKGKMPPFKDILTPADVDHVIAYLHTL
jgi:mono/diheme cytochrome c family protein